MTNLLPDYQQALEAALGAVTPLELVEEVPLADASGRVLAGAICADRDLPPFDRAQMDGYGLRACDLKAGRAFPVVARIAAGMSADVDVPAGSCVAIATGAPLPADVDCVVPHELSDRRDPVTFTIDSVGRGHAVHPRAADARTGELLITARTLLAAHHLGIAASAGHGALTVARRPRATIISSGDEVVPIDSSPLPHQIRNSNGPQQAVLLRRFGCDVIALRHVLDERGPTSAAVAEAVQSSDLVITIGGISAGERDHFPAVFDELGVEVRLQRAAIQPGKPVFVGRAPSGAVIVGLPGNPVSALVCSCIFIHPIVRAMLSLSSDLPWRTVALREPVKANPNRRAFRPARLCDDDGLGDGVIIPRWAGSGDLAHTATTDGVVQLPVQPEPVAAGAQLRFLPWP